MTIQPRLLKGFRDFLPAQMYLRQRVFEIIRTAFARYGYEPLETPVLEHADILTGKYGEEAEQLMYRFTDRGDRPVAMKYDLTVPACRVLAQYRNDLPLPFKRYQMQPVWRAENTQKGRFREFYQCDADTFGSSSVQIEAEFIEMGLEIMAALGFSSVRARINNRKLIDGIVQYAGAPEDKFADVCTAVDKLDKIGVEGVTDELSRRGLSPDVTEKIISCVTLSPETALSELKEKLAQIPIAQEGLSELEQIFQSLSTAPFPAEQYQFDPAIIRGLSYYTGPIWEFTITDGAVGSVGGGGRFDHLVKTYAGSDIPAAGGSFGVERIIEVMQTRQMMTDQTNGVTHMVTQTADSDPAYVAQVARQLRSQGARVLQYPDPSVKLEKQLKYADKKQIPQVVFAGPDEQAQQVFTIKDMNSGSQRSESLVY